MPLATLTSNALSGFCHFASLAWTDRARFLGRGHGPADPLALAGASPLSGTTGPVLDPIFSRGMLRCVPLLFCGKTTLGDIKTIGQLVEEGLVVPPRFVPPAFADLNALSAWMCFANFLNRLSLKRIEEDYAGLF